MPIGNSQYAVILISRTISKFATLISSGILVFFGVLLADSVFACFGTFEILDLVTDVIYEVKEMGYFAWRVADY